MQIRVFPAGTKPFPRKIMFQGVDVFDTSNHIKSFQQHYLYFFFNFIFTLFLTKIAMPNYIFCFFVASMLWSTCKYRFQNRKPLKFKFCQSFSPLFMLAKRTIYSPLCNMNFRFSAWMLRLFESNGQCREMPQHNQNMRTRRRCVFVWNSMG